MNKNSVCLVTTIGIPGSGKTTFCEEYSSFLLKNESNCIHVCYDRLIPLQMQSKLVEGGTWKTERRKIVEAVQMHLDRLFCKNTFMHNNEYYEKLSFRCSNSERTVLLIDDNSYLQSMRYDYYQLARIYNIGYAQLYFLCDKELAIRFNSSRSVEDRVPVEVIEKMASKLEAPKPFSNKWELFSFSINVQESVGHNLELVEDVVTSAMKNPVEPVDLVSVEEKEKGRIACSSSLIHQADRCLRELVNQEMEKVKRNNKSKEELRQAAISIQSIRNEVLEDLKTGFTKLDVSLVNSVKCREEGSKETLHNEIERIFHSKLNMDHK